VVIFSEVLAVFDSRSVQENPSGFGEARVVVVVVVVVPVLSISGDGARARVVDGMKVAGVRSLFYLIGSGWNYRTCKCRYCSFGLGLAGGLVGRFELVD
jgi:hypothetical protein